MSYTMSWLIHITSYAVIRVVSGIEDQTFESTVTKSNTGHRLVIYVTEPIMTLSK